MDCGVFWFCALTLVLAIYFYVKKQYKYWENRGFLYIKPTFPLGNVWGMGWKKHASVILQDFYRQSKGKDIVVGTYLMTRPMLLVLDLDFLRDVLVKDFQYFHDRGAYVNEQDDPLSGHLFALPGQKWRVLRAKLSPTFTSGKMKMMHSTIISVAHEFQKTLEPYAAKGEEIEFKDFLARFTTDVIGNCAFGIECNSLKNPDTEFRTIGKSAFEFGPLDFFRIIAVSAFPKLAKSLHMKFNSDKVINFFIKLLRDTIDLREKNNIKRNDFLSLMIQLKNAGKLEGDNVDLGKLTFEELAAQVFIFFVGGFDTSSSTMTFALYEMALNQDIQDQVREEVKAVLAKHGGEFTYEACMELKYLEKVIHETLRKYPILDNLSRLTTNDYKIPGSNRVIPKDTPVGVSVYAIHRDPEIYPNPEKFDPERFTEENIRNRHPMAYLPFGEGPRICVGMRFGMMQTRVGLASVISKFRIDVTQKTPIPITYNPRSAFLSPIDGMWLKIENL